MATILHIETSTPVCSVALSEGEDILFEKTSFKALSHAALVGVYAEEALQVLKSKNLKLDAVAVSSGPGSYTGLRIGVSIAKGLCFGFGIKLIGIPTLEILTVEAIRKTGKEKGLYCPMLDARRMEVYDAFYDENIKERHAASADIIDSESFSDILQLQKVFFFGNGSEKCQTVLASANACFISDVHPLASNMVSLANKRYNSGCFEDVAYYEPFYLKEFQATKAKNKVLGSL